MNNNNKRFMLCDMENKQLQLTEEIIGILKEADRDRLAYQWKQIDEFQRLRGIEEKKKRLIALMEIGADINTPDKDGWTPLMHASCMHLVEFVAFFIANDANIHYEAPDQRTAITLAQVEKVIEQFPLAYSYSYCSS